MTAHVRAQLTCAKPEAKAAEVAGAVGSAESAGAVVGVVGAVRAAAATGAVGTVGARAEAAALEWADERVGGRTGSGGGADGALRRRRSYVNL